MKTTNSALQSLIFSGAFVDFDCYAITLAGGTTLRYTSADFDISDGTHTWDSKSVLIDDPGAKPTAHWKVGLDVDTWAATFMPRPFDPITKAAWPDAINGQPFLAAAAAGAFDGAQVTVQRAYFASPPANPIPAAGVQPIGFLTVFFGLVGEVDVSSSRAVLNMTDMRQLLTINMPRLVYQAPCPHILFDNRCTLAAASYAQSGTALSGSTAAKVFGSVSAPGGSGTFTLGRIKFTTGPNAGISRTIRAWDGASAFSLLSPLPFTPLIGDAFSVYPGCDKQMSTCTAFGNLLNFGGTPFVPVPEVTV